MGTNEEADKYNLSGEGGVNNYLDDRNGGNSEVCDMRKRHQDGCGYDEGDKNPSKLILSTLPKTWIFDLDGTLVKHNGYKIDGHDTLIEGAKEYVDGIPAEDKILILTSRTDEYMEMTLEFLKENGIRYDEIFFNMPMGERIVVNDRKPSGIDMAVSVNLERDKGGFPEVERVL